MGKIIPKETEDESKTILDSDFIRYANDEIGICKPIEIQRRGSVLDSPPVFKYFCSEILFNSNLALNNVSG
jgi:hypothetical protein